MPVSSDINAASIDAVSARELITVCRQIAGMMEAEVDILRITRVLRSQTENVRLLGWYDELDHELTMGRAVSDAMTRAPELFSAFAVSLVRQGEERNQVAQAFSRLADFLQQENATPAAVVAPVAVTATPNRAPASNSSLSSYATIANPNEWNVLLERSSVVGAGILGALAIAESLVLIGWLPARWGRVAARVGGALALGAAAWAQQRRREIAPQNVAPEILPPMLSEEVPLPKRTFAAEPMEEAEEIETPRAFAGWMAEETTRAIPRRPRDEEEFD